MINKRHTPPMIPPIKAALLSSGDSKEEDRKEKVRRILSESTTQDTMGPNL